MQQLRVTFSFRDLKIEKEIFPAATDSRFIRAVCRSLLFLTLFCFYLIIFYNSDGYKNAMRSFFYENLFSKEHEAEKCEQAEAEERQRIMEIICFSANVRQCNLAYGVVHVQS